MLYISTPNYFVSLVSEKSVTRLHAGGGPVSLFYAPCFIVSLTSPAQGYNFFLLPQILFSKESSLRTIAIRREKEQQMYGAVVVSKWAESLGKVCAA